MAFREGNEKADGEQQTLKLDEPVGDDDEETKVRLDDADEDDDGQDDGDDEPEKAAEPPKGDQPRKKDGKWASKKGQRAAAHREAKAWERERAEYDRRFQREREETDRRINEMRQEVERMRQTPQNGQRADPFASKVNEINAQIAAELKLLESDDKHDYTRYHQLQEQKIALIAQQQAMMLLANQQQERQNQPQDKYAYRRPIISSEFPWTDDARYNELTRKAVAYRDYLINIEGRPDTLETDREAITQAVARWGGEFGLRAPAAPSPRTRTMWSAPASRGAPDRRPQREEVELGELGRGHGLSARALAAAVRSAMNDDS